MLGVIPIDIKPPFLLAHFKCNMCAPTTQYLLHYTKIQKKVFSLCHISSVYTKVNLLLSLPTHISPAGDLDFFIKVSMHLLTSIGTLKELQRTNQTFEFNT